ncbi:hypothetical protein ACWDBB_35960, partial [Kitasatospora sp. NPDC001095]
MAGPLVEPGATAGEPPRGCAPWNGREPLVPQLLAGQGLGGAAGDGFGFCWPAAFPSARIDQIMSKGGLDPV